VLALFSVAGRGPRQAQGGARRARPRPAHLGHVHGPAGRGRLAGGRAAGPVGTDEVHLPRGEWTTDAL